MTMKLKYFYFRELEELAVIDDSMKTSKPVVVIEDVNHMHFASGTPSQYIADYDILSPMPEV